MSTGNRSGGGGSGRDGTADARPSSCGQGTAGGVDGVQARERRMRDGRRDGDDRKCEVSASHMQLHAQDEHSAGRHMRSRTIV